MPKQSYPFYDNKHNMKKTKQMIKKKLLEVIHFNKYC